MKDILTPEEKLLRLIRGQKKPEKDSQPNQPLKNGAHFQTKQKETYFLIPKYLSFRIIQNGLLFIFIISCIFLAISVAYPFFAPKKAPILELTAKNVPEKNITLTKEIKPYEFYSDAARNKQIFSSPGTQQEQVNAPILIGNDLLKDMNLVGIVNGANPQAVIEDKKAQKTFYVSRKQVIGQFLVEEIQEGKIILSCNGQRYELYL